MNIRIGAVLSEMDPAGLEGDTVILTVPYTFHAQKMNSDEYRVVVEDVISRVMGATHTIECLTTDEYRSRPPRKNAAAPPPPEASSLQAEASDDAVLEPDPVSKEPQIDPSESLRAVRNIFDAEEIDPTDT